MKRRAFITLLGRAAATWPLAALAQQPKMPVIGLLSSASSGENAARVVAFQQGLRESGYVDGQNVAFEYRWAEGHYERLSALAADLVGRQVALIFASGAGSLSTQALKAATATIPIVFAHGSDPVKGGLVTSFNRPGGNVTGVSFLANALEAKRLGLLRALVPDASLIAVLLNPDNANAEMQSRDLTEAAHGLQLLFLNARSDEDFNTAFATLVRRRANALLVGADSFFLNRHEHLVALAARNSVPTIYHDRGIALGGGLMSYGASIADAWRQAGVYAGRVLKGERPADLPVLLPTKFELVINLKTAKTLGIAMPPAVLALADEVIE